MDSRNALNIRERKIYSRCLYYIFIRRENVREIWGEDSLRLFEEFARKVCVNLGCAQLALTLDANALRLLVEIPDDLSADYFAYSFIGGCTCWDDEHWQLPMRLMPDCMIEAVSPEDIGAVHSLNTNPDRQFEIRPDAIQCLAHKYMQISDSDHPWHHIIISTPRAKMSLNLKFRLLLQQTIMEICKEYGLANVNCSMRRNHVHILCQSHVKTPIASAVEHIKSCSMQWMSNNIHFHKVEGWSDETIVHTVSRFTLGQEMSNVYHQDEIHPKFEVKNEMSYIYQKMQIPYLFSLH